MSIVSIMGRGWTSGVAGRLCLAVLLGIAGVMLLARAEAAEQGGNKSEAVPFVKICTYDGHSYSYIPGSDACANGLALTIGTEDRHNKSLMNLPAAGLAASANRSGEAWPDPAIALKTEKAWGYAALVGGAHNLGANYSGDGSLASAASFGALNTCLQAGTGDCSRAKDNPGYFVGLEGEVRAPLLGAGDRVGAGIRFSQGGSSGFGGSLNLATPDLFGASNATAGFDSGAGLELTKAWSVQAGYDHQWAPNLNTSLFAGYSSVGVDGDPAGYLTATTCGTGGAASGCKSNWGTAGAGVRTSWAPASGLTLSVQTMYNYVWSGFSGGANGFGGAPAAGQPAGASAFSNQGVWSSYLRINRTFNSGE
jgi:hypothetical protein